MDEFAFEIALCAHLEATGQLVSRQLGTGIINPGHRISDIITVTPTTEFDVRKQITPNEIPASAIAASVGPGRYRYWKTAYRPLDIHPEQARESMEQAIAIGFFEPIRRSGRTYIRQTTRYPAWIDSIRAIENKPDLNRPGHLETQLLNDVTLGVVDEVILATQTHVTRAHLNRIPEEVGVWEFTDTEINVIRDPIPLPVKSPGIERLKRYPGRTDIQPVTPAEKSQKRRRLGERVYGKGWRTYELSDCESFTTRSHRDCTDTTDQETTTNSIDGLPYCTEYNRIIDPSRNCGSNCPQYQGTQTPNIDFEALREATSPWTQTTTTLATEQRRLDTFT